MSARINSPPLFVDGSSERQDFQKLPIGFLCRLNSSAYFCIWVAYEPCATASRKQITWIQTSFDCKWKVTKGSLEAAFSKKSKDQAGLWVFVNPDNPTGQCYSEN